MGDGRSPDDLTRLWIALVDEFDSAAPPEPTPTDDVPAPPTLAVVEAGSDSEPPPAGERAADPDENIDLTDLVDAPAHADQVVDRLTEAFPGAELHEPEETEE